MMIQEGRTGVYTRRQAQRDAPQPDSAGWSMHDANTLNGDQHISRAAAGFVVPDR